MKQKNWIQKSLTLALALMIVLSASFFSFADYLSADETMLSDEENNLIVEKDVKEQEQETFTEGDELEAQVPIVSAPSNLLIDNSRIASKANVTITQESQLLGLTDIHGNQCFTDAAWRTAVFNAVKNGNDGAVGKDYREALANFMGDIKADKKGIVDVHGIDLLRKVNKISLKHNEISDLSYLGQNSGDLQYKEWFGVEESMAEDRDAGTNVLWDFGGNPLNLLPENFGGRIVIEQAGTTQYTYPDNSGALYTYLRSSNGNQPISGEINVNKSKINKSGVLVNAKLESVSSLNKSPYMPLTITGFDHIKNDIAKFSGLTKTGLSKIAVGVDQEMHYWTEDEWGTSTPGSQSYKYYVTQRFQVWDKVSVRDNYLLPVKLVKTDGDNGTGNKVSGAEYKLFHEDGTAYKNGLTYTTDAKGEINVPDVPLGKYYFKETKAPAGYQINKEKIEFEVKVNSGNVATTLGGGAQEITTTSNGKLTAATNQRFIVAPTKDANGNVVDAGSAAISLTKGTSTTITGVKVTYAKLDVNGIAKTNEVKSFNDLLAAQNDINTQVNNNNVLGEVLVEVVHGSASTEEIKVNTKDAVIPKKDLVVNKKWIGDHPDWLKENNHPDITIRLYKNGKSVSQADGGVKVVSGNHNTEDSVTFTNLDTCDQYGNEYVYSISEDAIASFGSTKNGYATSIKKATNNGWEITIENTWTEMDRVNIEGIKEWDDYNDAYKKRPDLVTLILMQDNVEYARSVASKDNGWSFHFNNVTKYNEKDPTKPLHKYTIKEESSAISDYLVLEEIEVDTSGYTNGDMITLPSGTVVNKLEETLNKTVEINGTKIWEDYSDVYKKRPTSIEVELLRNNKPFNKKQTVSADPVSGLWEYSFKQLEKYDDAGIEYVYSIKENNVSEHYVAEVVGYDIINKIDHVKRETNVQGYKVWKDYNNAYETRPESVEITLLQNGKVYDTKTVRGEGRFPWRYNFQSLPIDDIDGNVYEYTLEEVSVPEGYVSIVADDNSEVVNTLDNATNEIVSISVKKEWVDKGKEFARPNVLRNGKEIKKIPLNVSNNWQAKIEGLDKYDEFGVEYTYAISEDVVVGYLQTNKSWQKGNDDNSWEGVFTNTKVVTPPTGDNTGALQRMFFALIIMSAGIAIVLLSQRYRYTNKK